MKELLRICTSVLGLGFFVFLLSVSISIIFLSYTVKRTNISVPPSKSNVFLYQEINPTSNAILNGVVKMNKTLSDDEYLSYSTPNGNQIIISNSASTRFECQGFCFCSTDQRRTSSNLLSRPLFLIISAISTSLALKIAEKTFHNQCLLHFSSTCDEEDIHSTVTSCSEKEEETTTESNKEFAEYSCEGYCITNKKLTSPDGLAAQKEYEEDIGGCESLKTSGIVSIERKYDQKGKNKYTLARTGEVKEYRTPFQRMHNKAVQKFSKDYLTAFCREVSRKEYWYHLPNNRRSKRQRRNPPMCVAGGLSKYFPDERLEYLFQNVKCQMTLGSKKFKHLEKLHEMRWGYVKE